MTDEEYMLAALQLAQKGEGKTNPNPMVGAVIVKNGRVIGSGFHERYGEKHAERNALANCCEPPQGAVMYVTLEPCCHTGRQPPCTEAILQSGIAKVVVGSSDPNPLVAGGGIKLLRENGVEVKTGVLKAECDNLNKAFFKFIQTETPFVTMKYAMTLDGKIATRTGASKWITGEEARADVHRLRNRCAAIMVGVGTVIADDPQLTCRLEGGVDPIRVICDSNLRTPINANVVKTARETPTVIACLPCVEDKKQPFINAGCTVIEIEPDEDNRIDLKKLMRALGQIKLCSLLLEGGAALNAAALKAGIVDEVCCYIAPKIFGGEAAKGPIGGLGVTLPSEGYVIDDISYRSIGRDVCFEGSVRYLVHGDS